MFCRKCKSFRIISFQVKQYNRQYRQEERKKSYIHYVYAVAIYSHFIRHLKCARRRRRSAGVSACVCRARRRRIQIPLFFPSFRYVSFRIHRFYRINHFVSLKFNSSGTFFERRGKSKKVMWKKDSEKCPSATRFTYIVN